MKLVIKVDTEKDNPEELTALINHLFTKNTTNDKERKYFCNNSECKKEITKKEVAYCLFKDEEGKSRFNGKVYCIECQEGKWGINIVSKKE